MIPFVILTGFLGSGKTTLLNRLLADRRELGATSKIGLIVNELGAIGVDGELLPPGASRQIELPGGCVCCVLSDDLGTTILEMIETTPGLEAIVLETTGVAEPLALSWALERPPVADHVRLAAVITLVDALTFSSSRPLSPAVEAQVVHGDVLLLTKAELASAAELPALAAEVAELAPRAELRTGSTAEHAAWLAALLADPPLDLHAALHGDVAAARQSSSASTSAAAAPDEPGAHQHPDCGDPAHDHHEPPPLRPTSSAVHLFDSVASFLPDVVVDLEELEDQLAALPASYFRIKGIIRAIDGRRANATIAWYAFHRVGLRVSSEPLISSTPSSPPSSARVVALGRDVEIHRVKACIESALVT